MRHPNYTPSPREARIARTWSRRLNRVAAMKVAGSAQARRLARILDLQRREGSADGLALLLEWHEQSMAQAIATAYRMNLGYDEIVRRNAA